MIGTRLGPYEITSKLGEGGMGEVWRATDSRLKREVAIKVLPAAFTEDKERLARFEREAQILAQLHHPNIASIFGLEEAGGVRALVMERVEGEDLSTLIARGPLPLAEATSIARQIAEALEAAHEQGIVHRDLKPANVKVTADGTVKVLDFGLARAGDPAAAGASTADLAHSPTLMNSPTLTAMHATRLGVILGTAAYMAPEQAKGRPVDKRADIWAFGVVVYEMLTGRHLFSGDDASDVLAAVLRQDVELGKLPAEVPARIRRLLARCLERDPKRRLRDIGEARLVLVQDEPEPPAASAAGSRTSRLFWPLVLALPVAAGLAAAIAWRVKPAPPAPTMRLSIALPAGEQVTTAPAISADGQAIAYVAGRSAATSRLYVRRLDDYAATAIDSSGGAVWPFFSPDSRSVAFFAGGKLWRAPVAGGTATALDAAPRGFGGTWASDGSIIYAPGLTDGLWRIAAEGGKPDQLTKPDDEANGYAHVFPQALGSGDILFTLWGKQFLTALYSPAKKAWSEVLANNGGRVAVETGSGHLLIGDSSADLLAVPWHAGARQPGRPETVVLRNVYWLPGTDRSWLSVADNGTAAYVPGDPGRRQLVWVDRAGKVEALSGDPDQTTVASVSRDGRRVAYNGRDSLWVRDLVSGTRTRIASEVRTWCGGWLPGDERVVLSSNKSGDWDLYTLRASGGEMEPLLKRPRTQHPMAVAPDGTVLFLENGGPTGQDLFTLSPDGKVSPLVTSPFRDWAPSVSPDGRYVAYMSNESGHDDVYAIPISGKGERVMISLEGGTGPVWSRDGHELFYRAGDDLMTIEVRSTNPTLVLGERRRLLDVSAFESQYFHEFDVSADGQRFLFIRAEPESRPTRINVILNWFPELAAKVPPR
jgi:Tol biopolymer transport system component